MITKEIIEQLKQASATLKSYTDILDVKDHLSYCRDDYKFIELARNHMDELIARVEELEKENDDLHLKVLDMALTKANVTTDDKLAANPTVIIELLDEIEKLRCEKKVMVEALEQIDNAKPEQDWPTDDDLSAAKIICKKALSKVSADDK